MLAANWALFGNDTVKEPRKNNSTILATVAPKHRRANTTDWRNKPFLLEGNEKNSFTTPTYMCSFILDPGKPDP